MGKISVRAAKEYFFKYCLPRRIRDEVAEQEHLLKTTKLKTIYRKVNQRDSHRGEVFPLNYFDVSIFAHFGIGIGIYFYQLISIIFLSFICMFIFFPIFQVYNSETYHNLNFNSTIASFTAVCSDYIVVNATCKDNINEFCQVKYQPKCQLTDTVFVADMVICGLVALFVGISVFVVRNAEEKLDVAVQTTQDYSVVVHDPTKDASDPDEWYNFFSNFGVVRCVTVVKNNEKLGKVLVQRHLLWVRLQHLKSNPQEVDSNFKFSIFSMLQKSKLSEINSIQHKICELDKLLDKLYQQYYEVCAVYVTFEKEVHQRLTLNELEVDDFTAYFDLKVPSICLCMDKTRHIKRNCLFRNQNILHVTEPVEPVNVNWDNLGYSSNNLKLRNFISMSITFCLLAACYFTINKAYLTTSPEVFSVLIAFLDILLTQIFQYLTMFEKTSNQSLYQRRYQYKLFFVRFLISTLFPYLEIAWNEFLTQDTIVRLLSIQLSNSLVNTIINSVDVVDLVKKYLIGKYISYSQDDYNLQYWSGISWNISDKYTTIIKLLFLNFVYVVLTPMSFMYLFVAIILIYFSDVYLLLRRYKQQNTMFNNFLSSSFLKQILLCLAFHMWITTRLLYSWPMDQAYLDTKTNVYHEVNKFPSVLILNLEVQSWHNSTQQLFFPYYKYLTYIVLCITIYFWLFTDLVSYVKSLFISNVEFVGSATDIEFSRLKNVSVYIPIITSSIGEEYLFANAYNVKGHNKPNLVYRNFDKVRAYEDITIHIPSHYRSAVLSNVKFYDDDMPIQKPLAQLIPTIINVSPNKAFQAFVSKKQKSSNKEYQAVDTTIQLNMAIDDKPQKNENIISKIVSSAKQTLSFKQYHIDESVPHQNNHVGIHRDDSGLNSIMKYNFSKHNSSIRPMIELEHYDP